MANIGYERGPMVIKSEDTFPVAYITFGMQPGHAEVEVVEQAREHLDWAVREGRLSLPDGVTYRFAGAYEQQVRAQQTLIVVLPVAMFIIFIIVYLQFKVLSTSLLVFSPILVAWSGGFLQLWLYSEPWFMNFSMFGANLRELFNMETYNLSVAVWVGFLALFGIAVDDGVVMATYLEQLFSKRNPKTRQEIRQLTIEAATKRIRPCLMTSATTILALLPVLASTGRGADIMIPMSIPSFGGMTVVLLSTFVVPVLYCMKKEWDISSPREKLSGRIFMIAAAALIAGIALLNTILATDEEAIEDIDRTAPDPAVEIEEDPHRYH